MARIAITDGMSDDAMKILSDAGHEISSEHFEPQDLLSGVLSSFDAVIVRSATKMTREVITSSITESNGIQFIGRAGVGIDNIDLEAASEHGIIVCNTPGASTRSVVELTIGHLLSSVRNIPRADRTMRAGSWEKKTFRGSEIYGKRLGLIGFGRIARGVADAARSLGMEIHAFDPYVENGSIDASMCTLHKELDDLFTICTHISVHCNFSEETKHIVNSARISLMTGVGADGIECGNHLISCARGGIIDEDAALKALESGQLSSLALDVFETEPPDQSPLLAHDDFHGSPHIAASTMEAQARIGVEMANTLLEFFDGIKPVNSLN
jgi:D-3-phosphoglycerate dehydrogenase